MSIKPVRPARITDTTLEKHSIFAFFPFSPRRTSICAINPVKHSVFYTSHTRYTVNYRGFSEPVVPPFWDRGSAAAGAPVYNLRLPPKALRAGHGLRGRRPDLRGLRLTAGRRPIWVWDMCRADAPFATWGQRTPTYGNIGPTQENICLT